MEGLTEGRIVHFVVSDIQHRAAIIVNIKDREQGIIDLFVFSMPQDERGGFFMYLDATYSAINLINTWHWIEKA